MRVTTYLLTSMIVSLSASALACSGGSEPPNQPAEAQDEQSGSPVRGDATGSSDGRSDDANLFRVVAGKWKVCSYDYSGTVLKETRLERIAVDGLRVTWHDGYYLLVGDVDSATREWHGKIESDTTPRRRAVFTADGTRAVGTEGYLPFLAVLEGDGFLCPDHL